MDLLFVEGNAAQKTEQLTLEQKESFLPRDSNNIFVYQDGEKIDSFSYDSSNGKLTLNDFTSSSSYLCFYNSGSYNYYDLSGAKNAYFELDIYGYGNSEEETTDFFMSLPSCSLLTNNRFIFQPNMLNKVSISFGLINYQNCKIIIG
jgi:hypothetical protein